MLGSRRFQGSGVSEHRASDRPTSGCWIDRLAGVSLTRFRTRLVGDVRQVWGGGVRLRRLFSGFAPLSLLYDDDTLCLNTEIRASELKPNRNTVNAPPAGL
jgi:hypothetical protein